jgi:hypothetical protein
MKDLYDTTPEELTEIVRDTLQDEDILNALIEFSNGAIFD